MASVVIETPPIYETPGNPDIRAPSQLYIKLIEADQLEGLPCKDPDLFVEFWIETLQGKELSGTREKTRVHKSLLHPIWNEEWVIPRLSTDATNYRLHFVLSMHFALWPNTTVGEGTVDLDTFVDDEMNDVWLNLAKCESLKSDRNEQELKSLAHDATVGKLRLLLHKTPLFETLEDKLKRQSEISKKWSRLSSLRIVLDKLEYFPGEVVRGMVISNTGNAKFMRALRLHVVGETKVQWAENSGEYNKGTFAATHTFIDNTSTLMGNGVKYGDGVEMEVQGKSFCFPFSFPLPIYLPPTFYGAYGSTQYRITTYADLRMKINKKTTVAFQVLARFYSSIPTAISTKSGADTHAGLRLNVAAIPFTISAPTLADAGSMVPVSLVIENPFDSGKTVQDIRVSLIQQSTFKARYTSWKSRSFLVNLVVANMSAKNTSGTIDAAAADTTIQVLPISPGQRRELTFSIEIPVLTPPTCPEQLCPIISNQYYIEGRIMTDGNYFTEATNKKQIPIVISRRYAMAPRPIDAPKHVEKLLPVRMAGDGSLFIDGSYKFPKSCFVPIISTISAIVPANPSSSSSQVSTPTPQQETPQTPDEDDDYGFVSIPLDRVYEPSSCYQQPQNALFDSSVLMTPPTKQSGQPTTSKYLIESIQHVSGSDNTCTAINGCIDGPVSFIANPSLVVYKRTYDHFIPDPKADFPTIIPHRILIPTNNVVSPSIASAAISGVIPSNQIVPLCPTPNDAFVPSTTDPVVVDRFYALEASPGVNQLQRPTLEVNEISIPQTASVQPSPQLCTPTMPPSYQDAISLQTQEANDGETGAGDVSPPAPFLQVPTNQSSLSMLGKYFNVGTEVTLWSPSQDIPSFDCFLPPRPLDLWSMNIPVSAAKLPDYTKLQLE